jgi:beta-xylosidase
MEKRPNGSICLRVRDLIPGIVNNDDFDRKRGELALPLVWQWNHNPDNSLWSVTERKGFLRLKTGRTDTLFVKSRNTLTQRTIGPVSSGITKLDASNLKEGDFAGLCVLQRKFGQVGVKMLDGKKHIFMVSNKTETPTELGKRAAHTKRSLPENRMRLPRQNRYCQISLQS